jgi:hypothetical protein
MEHYFIYKHIRADNGQVFYIGCGKYPKDAKSLRAKQMRAYQTCKRNKHWNDVFEQTRIKVKILFITTCKKTAYLKEKEYIKHYGRLLDGKGTLTNLSKSQGGCERDCNIRITQMDMEGNTIKIWEQLKDIQSEMDFLKTNIVKVCRKKQLSAYGFLWKYTDDRSFDNVYPSTSRGRYKGEKCSINKSGIILTNTVTGEEKMFRRQKDIAELFGINRYYINESVYGRYNIDGYTLRYREPCPARIRQN